MLMQRCFEEYFRVLKPGRWMTVLFHNSKNAVWIAIQSALEKAGFVVADVRVFDKKQLTMKQQTTTGAVQKDLLISSYRPNGGLEQQFQVHAGSSDGVWDFVRQHLKHLPVFIETPGPLRSSVSVSHSSLRPHGRISRPAGLACHRSRGVLFGLQAEIPGARRNVFLADQVAEYDPATSQVNEWRSWRYSSTMNDGNPVAPSGATSGAADLSADPAKFFEGASPSGP